MDTCFFASESWSQRFIALQHGNETADISCWLQHWSTLYLAIQRQKHDMVRITIQPFPRHVKKILRLSHDYQQQETTSLNMTVRLHSMRPSRVCEVGISSNLRCVTRERTGSKSGFSWRWAMCWFLPCKSVVRINPISDVSYANERHPKSRIFPEKRWYWSKTGSVAIPSLQISYTSIQHERHLAVWSVPRHHETNSDRPTCRRTYRTVPCTYIRL